MFKLFMTLNALKTMTLQFMPWLLWLLPLSEVASEGPDCISMSMVQTKLHLEPLPKPWEVHHYITAGYHKAGVFLTGKVHQTMFTALGAGQDVMGRVEYPCYSTCINEKAPILWVIDGFNASWEAAHPSSKPLLVAGSVRDPLQMVASAYCYHHEGKELINDLMPGPEIFALGPEEGTALTAEYMLPVIESMASIFAEPDNNTLRLQYEELTESSEGFDRGMARWLDHYFGDSITSEQRSSILEAVKQFDLHRNPEDDYSTWNTANPNHTSDPECKEKASQAVLKMDTSLLQRYQEMQQRLGYAATTV